MIYYLRIVNIALLLSLTVFINGCATYLTSTSGRTLAKPCDDCYVGVRNFAKVSDALWRGDQPTADGFRNLEAAGVKTIINLRHDHDDLDAPKHRNLLDGTKLKYLWIPARGWNPEIAELVMFLKVLEDPNNWPVFVHCAAGKDRTGYAVATYRIVEEGWEADDAIHEMFDFNYHPIFFGNPGFLRSLKVGDMKKRVELAPLK